MSLYKVTVTNGVNYAPSLYVEASKYTEAKEKARSMSGLSRFKSWHFYPLQIK